MKIGYGRVSTTDQNPDSQKDALAKAGAEKIFIDTFTGTKANRPELDKVRALLRTGDSLVITRLDRLGRSLKDLLAIVTELDSMGVNLEVLEQKIDTTSAEGRLFFHMVAAFAEFERELMRSRTLDGLEAARARGRVGGRKGKLTQAQVAQVLKMHHEGDYIKHIAEIFEVSRPTIYRAIEESMKETQREITGLKSSAHRAVS
jgi:DNA invertase Pin-like site-specific DNA recombinase